jgi:hypothetical protein
LIQDGAIARLILDAALFYARSDVNYAAGSINVGFSQAQNYDSMGNRMMQLFRAKVVEQKTAENVDMASSLQVVRSDYWSIHTHPASSLPSSR